ncbi:hypothetical protein ACO0K0_01520 [Undibacterium sp. SXout11W]|uniref:hypothetical protein n=1 Tax=Undibacterium sp. SXout11W TaxID=3413050 RepID=UPI003BF077E8
MSFYKVRVKAGVKYLAPYSGKFFTLDDCGEARLVDVQLSYQGQDEPVMPQRCAGFQCPASFDKIYFTSAIDSVVQFFVSDSPVKLGAKDGAQVNVPNGVAVTNTVAAPIPVSIATPVILNATAVAISNPASAPVPVQVNNSVAQPLQVALPAAAAVQINNTPAQSIPVVVGNDNSKPLIIQRQTITTIVDLPAATVGIATTALISNNTLTRLRIRSANTNTGAVYIGGSGVTKVNAAIVLQPGDIWSEEDLAGAPWFVCADNANSVVTMQGAH